ncbi:MAG: UbiA-like polyprenyltransferase [Planctomycetota bacterium]
MQAASATTSPSPLLAIAADIKLAHSVFALPFALLAAALAYAAGPSLTTTQTLLALLAVVGCMICARTYAMTLNRRLDAAIDARNPRTAIRAIPAGRVSNRQMSAAALLSAVGLILGAAAFWPLLNNPWPLAASPLVLLILGVYPLTKRVTWLCHAVLGLALALSPLAAALAVYPPALAESWPWWLAAGVLAWVAGFDILYALQDVATDRRDGVYSLPASLGVRPALFISRGLHLAAAFLFLEAGLKNEHLGVYYLAAVCATVPVLILEHFLTATGKTDKLPIAFGTLNGIIAILLGLASATDLVLN